VTHWKSIKHVEELEAFLAKNPTYYVVHSSNCERRYRVCSDDDKIGISVDGRSVNAISFKLKIRSEA